LTYGVDMLHGGIRGQNALPLGLNVAVLALFCAALFVASVRNIHRRWIL
jgi:ABC-2 type transport system permease protein